MVTGYLDNYYARLGVPHTATQEEIRNAFHAAARKFHPDANKDTRATEIFLQIQEAYETLSNPAKRIAYDEILPKDIKTPSNVLVNTIYSRESLTVLEHPQLLYVMLNIMAAPKAAEEMPRRQPMNLCLVIDTSNSMSGPWLNTVKETALNIVQSLKSGDILSVVTFNDRAEVIIPASRNQNLNILEARISLINARGGTEIFQGLEMGYNEIIQNLSPDYANHIILITDGRTYGDEEDALKLAEIASDQSITIHALGIGSEWNDEFLEDLASSTGGSCEYAYTSDGIRSFFQRKFGHIQNSFANNVSLSIKTPESVTLNYVFRLTPDSTSIPISDTLFLGDIPRVKSLSVVLEFQVKNTPRQKAEFVLLDGILNMVMPTASIPNFSSRLTFSRKLEENPLPAPPPRVLVEALSRLSLYRLQEMAREDIKEGNLDKATSRLKNLATQLLTSGETALAHTVMLELDQIRSSQQMGPDAEKRIKYGTRALLVGNLDQGP
ncbi:MAG: VWA domain-containing protein [Anaerolineales bacterium]|nr:VWA domain-containing protein [Anaerolineales bacterium]